MRYLALGAALFITVVGVCGLLFVLTLPPQHLPALDHTGELQHPCFPDGECMGHLRCLDVGVVGSTYRCVP